MHFLDVSCGFPNSMQDSMVIRNSGFYSDVVYSKSKLYHPMFIYDDDILLREYIIANAGYPLYN